MIGRLLCWVFGHPWRTVGTLPLRPLIGPAHERHYQACGRCHERRVLETVPDTRVEWEKWVAGDRDDIPPGVTPQ